MNILAVGKYPPMQGGVSTQMYGLIHGLARRSHRVTLVTDGRTARSGNRAAMRPKDWRIGAGTDAVSDVKVVWGDDPNVCVGADADERQFESLCRIAAAEALAVRPDVVFTFYMEPYSFVGDRIARRFSIPHVVRTAGSDTSRFRNSKRLASSLVPILDRAAVLWTSVGFAKDMELRGYPSEKLQIDGGFGVDLARFRPRVRSLNVDRLRRELAALASEEIWGHLRSDLRYVGMYGKFEVGKGHECLLDAIALLARQGRHVGAVLMGGGDAAQIANLRQGIAQRGLAEHVVRLPFLPPWRVPEFLRLVDSVCCLEQSFRIEGHNPAVAREVMVAGKCLIASTEILEKLPFAERFASGYNCIAISDVRDAAELARAVGWATEQPAGRHTIERRARKYGDDLIGHDDADVLCRILDDAVGSNARMGAVKRQQAQQAVRSYGPPKAAALAQNIDAKIKSNKPTDADQPRHARWARDVAAVSHAVESSMRLAGSKAAQSRTLNVFRLPKTMAGLPDGVIAKAGWARCEGTEFLKLLDIEHDGFQLLEAVRRGDLDAPIPQSLQLRQGILVKAARKDIAGGIYLVDSRHIPGIRALIKGLPSRAPGASGLRLFEMGLIGFLDLRADATFGVSL